MTPQQIEAIRYRFHQLRNLTDEKKLTENIHQDLSLGAVMLHPGMAPFYTMRDLHAIGSGDLFVGHWDVPTIIKNQAANIPGVELRTEQ